MADYYRNDYPLATVTKLVRSMTPLCGDDDSRRLLMIRSDKQTIRPLPLCELGERLSRFPANDGVHIETTAATCCVFIDVDYGDGTVLPAPRRDGLCQCKVDRRQVCARCWPLLALNAAMLDYLLCRHFGFASTLLYTSGRRGYHCVAFPPDGDPLPVLRDELCHRLWNFPRTMLQALCARVLESPEVVLSSLESVAASPREQPWVVESFREVVLPRFVAEWMPHLGSADTSVPDAVENLRSRTLAHNAHDDKPPVHCLDCRINAAVVAARRCYQMRENHANYDEDPPLTPPDERWDVFLVLMRLCLFEVDESASVAGHAFRLPFSPHCGSVGMRIATPFNAIDTLNIMPELAVRVGGISSERMGELKSIVKRAVAL